MAPPGIILRPADATDLQRLLALSESAPGAPRWSPSTWQQILRSPSTTARLVLMAESANECVGFGVVGLAADVAEIESLAVSADWRRQGVARLLCSHLLKWAHARHATQASLEVRLTNIPARALYESLGFEKNAVRRGYYRDPEEDALVMTMVL
ncbi:MAG TPA: ribosomal protein S18-alanine N-acetyltransferase [Acidobacteriaceae bacterium]|nr:ribosomal protein S18-alanine N-acetyltransferase [Acidobacteriaceae bacterium]